ncbi:MAG: ComEA family DNA-binding protein [Terriglobia bacterium]
MRVIDVSFLALSLFHSTLIAQQNPEAPNAAKVAEPAAIVVDINRATAEDFTKLPGIGPELARRIVTFREKHGPFKRVEDLLAIRGIGRKKWKVIRPSLKIDTPSKKKAEG